MLPTLPLRGLSPPSRQDRANVGRWVHPKYFIERALLVLCDEMTKIIDDPRYVHLHGEATLKLSNALADYGDSLWEHR